MRSVLISAIVILATGCPKPQPPAGEPKVESVHVMALTCEENPLNDTLSCEGEQNGWCEYGTLAGFRGAGCPPAGTDTICVRCDGEHPTCPRVIALVATDSTGAECTFDRPILTGGSCKRSCPSRYRYSFK